MIQLGTFDIRTSETFDETRRKILRLAKALGFTDIDGSRMASIFSEMTRPVQGQPSVTVSLALNFSSPPPTLVFQFTSLRSCPGHADRFFDTVEHNGGQAFLCLRHLPHEENHISDADIAALRDMLALPSREELLHELKEKNDALHQEVAERRQAEEALRRSETRILAVLEGTPDPLILVNEAGIMTFVNSQVENTFEYDRSELLGQSIEILLPPELRPQHVARVQRFFQDWRTREFGMELGLYGQTKSGKRIAIDIKLSPLHTEAGPRAVASIRDVTEQKKNIESLKKLSLVVEQSPASVVITDRNGTIEYVNPEFTVRTGYTPEDVLGKNPRLLNSGKTPQSTFTAMWSTITAGKIWRGTIINAKKNGEEFFESTAIAPIFDQKDTITHFVAIKEDITENIRKEEEIERQRTLLDTLVNVLPLLIYSKNAHGAYQIANDSLCALIGRTRSDILGKTAHEVFPKDVADKAERAEQAILREKKLFVEEGWRTYPNGRKALFQALRVPILDKDGQATGLVGALIDITERKQAEDAIRSAQAEMTQIFNTAGGGMRVIDNDCTVLKVNNAFVELSGYEREEVVGQKCYSTFGGSNCNTKTCPLQQIHEGEMRVEFTTRKVNRYGTAIYCDVTVTPFTSSEGQQLGIIEDFRDVTERVIAQERILKSESKYRELVESAKSIIIKINLDGNITFFNEYAQTFFGWRSEEIVGKPILGTIVPASETTGRDLRPLVAELVMHPEQYEKNENENICRDGTRVWVSWTNQVTRDEHTGKPTGLLCIGIDATERKKAQDGLRDALDVISGSIRYASRIQRAVLPPDNDFSSVFSNHFIIWHPRDVVGGDIYWSAKWGQGSLFALGDCTGHGVPGAFMTLITTGALSQALTEVEPGSPGRLLRRAHQIVQSSLNQHTHGGESDDGMELGICYFPPEHTDMIYVGARFPLFIMRDDEIEEIKPNKKGIGYRGIPQEQHFEERHIHLEPGLRLYMVSDGVFDQIGGEKRQGFGKKRFKSALLSLTDVPFAEHGQHLYTMLENYQGNEKRRDDVSMLGLEF